MTYHAHDNLFFTRTPQGDVRIRKFSVPPPEWPKDEDVGDQCDITLNESVWASAVCSVSAEDETWERWMAARKFHGIAVGTGV